jgi:hypothetical protein
MTNIYKTILFKIVEPIVVLDKEDLRKYIKSIKQKPTVNTRVELGVCSMLERILALIILADWVLSNEPPEELGK